MMLTVFSVVTRGVSLAFEFELFLEVYLEFVFLADLAPLHSFMYLLYISIFFVYIFGYAL